MVRLKREHALRKRAIREYQRNFDYWVNWYVFEQHTPDNLYDEPGDRSYKGPYKVPVLWVFDEEGNDTLTGTGREIRRVATFAIGMQALRHAGISTEPDDRQNDIIQWDGFYWDVQSVLHTSLSDMQSDPGNRIYEGSDELTARVKAIRRFPDHDLPFDTFPEGP